MKCLTLCSQQSLGLMTVAKGWPLFQENPGIHEPCWDKEWLDDELPDFLVSCTRKRSRGEATPLGNVTGKAPGTRPTAQTCLVSAALARQQFPISNLGLKGQTPEPGRAGGHEPFHLHLQCRDSSGAARTLPEGKGMFPQSTSAMIIKQWLQCSETSPVLGAGSENLSHADCTRY